MTFPPFGAIRSRMPRISPSAPDAACKSRARGFFAIDDTCIHQGGPLSEGSLEGDVVICPWHRWEFNLTTGQNDLDPEVAVRSYPVIRIGNEIFIEIYGPKILRETKGPDRRAEID